LRFELYAVVGQIDGAGFAAAYLFLDNAKKMKVLELKF
jgi:hypothetical protein